MPRMDWEEIVSERTRHLPESEFEHILKLATEGKEIISLGPGEPDFPTPKEIIEAACTALQKGFTHYAPTGGRTDLKEALAKKLKKENAIPLEDPQNEIVVTAGSTEAILLGLMATVDPGEEVLVPNPGFLAYTPTVDLVTGFPIPIPLREETGFQMDLDALRKTISSKTRAIILNTPSNPTGTVMSKNVLEELADIAREHSLVVMADEAYEKLVYDDARHVSFASLNGMHEHTLTFHTFSKSYAMAGFRLGYAAGHSTVIEKMSRIHIYTSLAASTVSQIAGLKALNLGDKPCEKMRTEYNKRRKLVLKRISEWEELHIQVPPEGAFYAFPRMKGLASTRTSKNFAHWLLREAKVLVVPGNEFGSLGEGFIRLSYATKYELIEQALDRMEAALKHLR